MRLTISNRIKIINMYEDSYYLHNTKSGIRILLQKVKEQGINISDKGLRNLLKKVRETGSVLDKSRDGLSYVTLAQLNQLESRLRIDRGLTSARLKESIGLHVSTRTVRNNIHLGWRSIRIKFCQYVSNVIEQVFEFLKVYLGFMLINMLACKQFLCTYCFKNPQLA